MNELPAHVVADIDELGREFGPLEVSVADVNVVVVALTLRGVEVRLVVETTRYPGEPPTLLCDDAWLHPNFGASGEVIGLMCQTTWNRTYGLCQPVRELHSRLMAIPPAR